MKDVFKIDMDVAYQALAVILGLVIITIAIYFSERRKSKEEKKESGWYFRLIAVPILTLMFGAMFIILVN